MAPEELRYLCVSISHVKDVLVVQGESHKGDQIARQEGEPRLSIAAGRILHIIYSYFCATKMRGITERTPLRRSTDSPDYIEFASLLRTRRTRLRQFQCCVCGILM